MTEAEDAILRELGKQTTLLRELVAQVTRLAGAAAEQAGHTADLAETAEKEATAAALERYHQGKGPKPK